MTQPDPLASSEPGKPLSTLSLFNLIHDLHQTITTSIDSALTWDQLNSPAINYTLVRPIIDRLMPDETVPAPQPKQNRTASGLLNVPAHDDQEASLGPRVKLETCLGAVLFALMANRMQFISLGSGDLSYAPLQSTRAAFCELLAIKVIRKVPHPDDEAQFAGELVRGYCAFDGAPEDVWEAMGDDRSEVEETRSSALEMAIVTTAKRFLSLPMVQHLIREIYVGHLVYSPSSSRGLIDDSYISERTKKKRQPSHSLRHRPRPSRPTTEEEKLAEVYLYNPYDAGWLDHGRLRVPKWRKWLEFTSFGVLLALFIATLYFKNLDQVTVVEIAFMVFTAGFMLDEFAASQEHGWTVYSANAWNVFDITYICIFLLYFILRIVGLATHHSPTSDLAFDILACSACILFPRMVFFLIKDNVLILALRAMIARYVNFMGLVILAFSGICFCLWTLGRGTWTVRQITWLMLQIWFGSSYLGFSSSESFHPVFGPIILISYAALCNTLLITILISILSNEFAEINANAQEEHLFQRIVKTVEGVRSDAIFSYLPPVNILALTFLTPLSWMVSPRTLHRINVFCIRLTSFPYLMCISAWERWDYRSRRRIHLNGPEHIQRPSMFDSFLGGGSEILISSVFDAAPPIPSKPATPQKPKTTPFQETESPSSSDDERKTWDSPLAEIFGNKRTKRRARGAKRGNGKKDKDKEKGRVGRGMDRAGGDGGDGKDGGDGLNGLNGSDEVDRLKEEVKAVRESQLRMEEMLAKVLAAGK